MQTRMYRSFQGLLLLGLCIFFASKAANGQLTWYINSRFIPLTIFGVIFLAVLAQIIFTEIRRSRKHDEEHGHEHDHRADVLPAQLAAEGGGFGRGGGQRAAVDDRIGEGLEAFQRAFAEAVDLRGGPAGFR